MGGETKEVLELQRPLQVMGPSGLHTVQCYGVDSELGHQQGTVEVGLSRGPSYWRFWNIRDLVSSITSLLICFLLPESKMLLPSSQHHQSNGFVLFIGTAVALLHHPFSFESFFWFRIVFFFWKYVLGPLLQRYPHFTGRKLIKV